MEKVINGVANIVVVGSWNKAILTPEWVKENLLNEYDSFEVAYPVNGLGSLKYITPDFSFMVVDGRLQFELERYDSDSMKALSRTARKVFRLLGHTPITAMGVNYLYRDYGTEIPSISITDNDDLVSILGCSIASQQYQRVFQFSDSERLFLSITCENSQLSYAFNFDYRLSKVSDLLNILGDDDDILLQKQDRADFILQALISKKEL